MTFFFIIATHLLSTSGLSEVRETYFLAVDSETATNQLLKMCEDKNSPEYLAYRGTAFTLKASFSYNPLKKLDYFEKGKQLIEKAVNKRPQNVEIRFLRFTVQKGAPKMLGYYRDKNKDRKFLEENIEASSLPDWYKNNIDAYLNSK